MGKWSPETLNLVRRLRKARRLFKSMPLFAYEILQNEYPGYTHEQFISDINRKKPKKRKDGSTTRSPLIRYGRYYEMLKMVSLYYNTGDPTYGIKAQQLRKYLTKPYRVIIRISGSSKEYNYPSTLNIQFLKKIIEAANKSASWDEFIKLEGDIMRYSVH